MSLEYTIPCYFKIPFTEIRDTIKLPRNITMTEFLEFVNVELRNILNIHSKYYIEVVETNSSEGEYGPALLPSDSQTFEQRYGNLSIPVAFYARPVNAETGQFVRQTNYHV